MTKKMTPWYPAHIKPVRKGVYRVFIPNSYANKYAYFDAFGWRLCAKNVKKAEKEKKYFFNRNSSMNLLSSKWRGFTKEQK